MSLLENISFGTNNKRLVCDLTKPIDISIPLVEGENNVNCYYAEPVRFQTISFGENFIGSVAQGGSCNYQKITLTPHGNGTHTECYGHISKAKVGLSQCLKTFHFLAQLITLKPHIAQDGDAILLKKDIQEKLKDNTCEALIVRTLPNNLQKLTKQYTNTNPPYFEESVGVFLADRGVKHLLIDLPSVDREVDGGKLAVHRGFWQYPQATRVYATITELIFVPDEVEDGMYLLNLQITSLDIDASPSKPILYKINEIK